MLEVLGRVVDSLPVGVIVLDAAGRAVVFNRVEERLAGRRREDVIGSDFFRDHGYCMDIPELAGTMRAHIGRGPFEAEAELTFPFPYLATPREVRVSLTSFEANEQPYGLLVIRDVAHERAVRRMRETLGQMLLHDLRAPLTVVTANLGLLSSEVRDTQDARQALEDAMEGARRLQSMLTTLLETSRLETNELPLLPTDVDVRALANSAASLVRAIARARAVEVVLDPDPGVARAQVDPDVVVRICENLLDNAMRYATRVAIRVLEGDAHVSIEVTDDGPGIPPAQRARIFEKYARVGPEGRRVPDRDGGHGLGLHFVRLAARAHGGDVVAECPPEGGARFSVRLPRVSPLLRPR